MDRPEPVVLEERLDSGHEVASARSSASPREREAFDGGRATGASEVDGRFEESRADAVAPDVGADEEARNEPDGAVFAPVPVLERGRAKGPCEPLARPDRAPADGFA